MAFMEKIQAYKQSVLELLWQDDGIKSIIQESAGLDEISFEQFCKYVKKYAKNPETITEKGAYILIEADSDQVHNPATMSYQLSIGVIISEELMERKDGVLSDILVAKIDRLLNGNSRFGIGRLGLLASKGLDVPVGFYGRYVVYQAEVFNRG